MIAIVCLILLTSTSLLAVVRHPSTTVAPPSVPQRVIRALQRIRGIDTVAPTSRIESPPARSALPTGVPATISGTATDSGGGKVARVEVSTDGGRTWSLAQGTDQWKFVWTPSASIAITLLSRATDDSGNVEVPVGGVTVITVAAPAGSRLKASATSAPAPAPPPAGGGCGTYSCGDKTLADFQAGSSDQALAVAHRGPGELILKPAKVWEFAALPADWVKVEPPLGAGSVTFNNGVTIVENAYAYSVGFYSQPRSIEFWATFTGPNQRVGAATAFLDVPSWARFGTDATGTQLLAESANGVGTPTSTPLNVANAIGQPHVFRIEWTSTGINYLVDDNAVASHSTVITSDMRKVIRDDAADGKALSVRWMRLSPYAATATFQSRIFDRGSQVLWTKARWSRVGNSGSPITLCARTGNTAIPDATWSTFTCQSQMDPSSALNVNQRARYAQYQATLTGNQFSTVQLAVFTIGTGVCSLIDLSTGKPISDSCNDFNACTNDSCCDSTNGTPGTPTFDPICAGTGVCDPNDPACSGPPSACVHTLDPSKCSGSFCSPLVCDPTLSGTATAPVSGCVAGPAPCSLTNGCLSITCNNTTAHCDATPVNAACHEQPIDNPCTVDTCNLGVLGAVDGSCTHTPGNAGTPCDDLDVCTKNDTCQSGVCTGTDVCGGRVKVSGGGCVPTLRGTKAEFAFSVERKPTGKTKGHFTYHDQRSGIKIHGLVDPVNGLVKTGPNTATFTGKYGSGCNTCTFTVDVVDNGEPGKNDRIRVRISGTQTEDTGTTGTPTQQLCGGNIRFHPGGRHFDHDDDHAGHEFDDD